MEVDVLQRSTPAAHHSLAGRVLIDTGGGAAGNVERVLSWLDGRPVDVIALTHPHLDHAGGAVALRERLGAPIAMARADVETLARDAERLRQPVAPFTADRLLDDGDTLPGGIEAVATPGQTPGHLAYWAPVAATVFTGDLLQAADVAWLPFDEGVLDDAIRSVRRLAGLGAAVAVPGHGPVVRDVASAAAANVARYEGWRAEPARQAWHGARRIAAGRLALEARRPGRAWAEAIVADVPLLEQHARVLGLSAAELAARAIEQLLGSGALSEDPDGQLVMHYPHEAPG